MIKILVSQPTPAVIEKSPFFEVASSHKTDFTYQPLNRIEGISLKEFRAQRIEILDHTAVIFTSRTTVDSFFNICKEARITIPETMKYICQTEAVALYLQKYIVYRKRKVSFADGTFQSLMELILKQRDEKLLLTLSEPFKPELPDAIARLKLNHSRAVLARTVATDLSDFKSDSFDIIALYSPADVKALTSQVSVDNTPHVAVFGDATLRAAIEAGLTVKAMAPTPVALSMAKALDIYLTKREKGIEIEEFKPVDNSENEEFLRSQQTKLERKRSRKAEPAKAK